MILVHDKGQMCNNILQFAHVYAWATENGRKCVSMRFAYKYQYFHICNTSGHNFMMYLIGKYGGKMHIIPTVHYDLSEAGKSEKEAFILSHSNVVVEGWGVRYYDLYIKHIDKIRSLFQFKPEITRKVSTLISADDDTLRIGVHIRRGDYKRFFGGRYYFEDDAFIHYIRETIRLFAKKHIAVYICGNDPHLDREVYAKAVPEAEVIFPDGNPGEDLCLLSQCDYLIGPPSSFSLIATMYRDNRLFFMTSPGKILDKEDFQPFSHNFRIFDSYFD